MRTSRAGSAAPSGATGDDDATRGAETGGSALAESSARAHSARLGATDSTDQASRWRSTATCESQQEIEQNTSRMRLRLHVDTLHAQ